MSIRRRWCDVCRGDIEPSDQFVKCISCPRRFHQECIQVKSAEKHSWKCTTCQEEPDGEDTKTVKKQKRKRILAVKTAHANLRASRVYFLKSQEVALAPFTSDKLRSVFARTTRGTQPKVPDITPDCPFIKGTLRPYQVTGVNWVISQYRMGVGCIIGDEMGLGKTIQTLTFIAALKNAGLPGAQNCKWNIFSKMCVRVCMPADAYTMHRAPPGRDATGCSS